MKQFICGILACVTAFASIAMVGCGKDKEPAHEHAYVETTIPATCTQEGYNQFVCECGDSYKGETVLPKTAHTGAVTCTSCQLNYFDEVKQLVIANGQLSNNGQYYYKGEKRSSASAIQETYVSYDPSAMNIFLGLSYEMPSLGAEYTFLIMIQHPSSNNGMQSGKYTWYFGMLDSSAMGTLNGVTFSSLTTSLTIEYNDGFKSSILSSVRSMAADFANYAIKDAFIPLLKLGTNGVTPANFGLVNYTL